jgi:hypothetical protein
MIDKVRKAPANIHQPPLSRGTNGENPYSGPGGSSDSQNSWRTNWTGFQPTDAHMFRPMISNAMNPNTSDATPR